MLWNWFKTDKICYNMLKCSKVKIDNCNNSIKNINLFSHLAQLIYFCKPLKKQVMALHGELVFIRSEAHCVTLWGLITWVVVHTVQNSCCGE